MSVSSREIKKRTAVLSLAILMVIPVLIGFFSTGIRNANGPYWLGENLDPTYAYLLNSLAIADFHRPLHTDHPGTPIQVISGGIIRLLNLRQTRDGMTRSVLADPEHYIRLLNDLFILFCCVCSALVGYVALNVTGNLAISLMLQTTPFLSSTTQQGLTGLRPEPLLVSLSLLVVALVILTFKFDVQRYAFRFAIGFGLISGIAVASKINFFPVLLIPVIILPSWRSRIRFCLATAGAFVFCIVPILAPLQFRNAFGFLVGVTTHTGRYGAGKVGIIDPGQYLTSVANLVTGDLLFFTLLLISVSFLLVPATRSLMGDAKRRALMAACAAEVLQLLIVAKHPHSRYLVPGLALAGLNLMLIADVLLRMIPQQQRLAVGLVMCLGVFAISGLLITRTFTAARQAAARQFEAVEILQRDFTGATVVDYYTASSLPYALEFGSGYSGNIFGNTLQQLYPNHYFYNLWNGQFMNFAGPVDPGTVTGKNDWFIMHGYSLTDSDFKVFLPENPLPANIKLENVFGGDIDIPGELDGEAIYKAHVTASAGALESK